MKKAKELLRHITSTYYTAETERNATPITWAEVAELEAQYLSLLLDVGTCQITEAIDSFIAELQKGAR